MYRENIYDIVEATGQPISTLVIPKNTGLKGYAWKVLKEAGLNLDNAQKISKIALRCGNLTILLRRGEDIPQIVEDEYGTGRIVLGITGDDLFDEYRLRNSCNKLRVENTYNWYDDDARFKRPALSLVSRTGNLSDLPIEARVAVNGKYEFNGRLYLSDNPLLVNRRFILKFYSGDLEAMVVNDTNNCCIDIVYSGNTIETIDDEGLRVIEKIRFTDLVVISPLRKEGPGLLEMKAREIPKGLIIDRTR